MIGASKILTVSYGTFSCTLEGFDEPFNTMKAIAEYFRDLAADDRYFGAEPPTPDAAMLHQIAEREIKRRVEAKIKDNGVILRAEEPDDAVSDAPLVPHPQHASRAALSSSVAHVEVPAQRNVPAEVAEPAAEVPPPGQPVSESVAAKLARIRSAVAQAKGAAPAAAAAVIEAEATEAEYTEDQHADEAQGTAWQSEDLIDADSAVFDDAFGIEEAAVDQTHAEAVAEVADLDLSDLDLPEETVAVVTETIGMEDPLPEDIAADDIPEEFETVAADADADDQDDDMLLSSLAGLAGDAEDASTAAAEDAPKSFAGDDSLSGFFASLNDGVDLEEPVEEAEVAELPKLDDSYEDEEDAVPQDISALDDAADEAALAAEAEEIAAWSEDEIDIEPEVADEDEIISAEAASDPLSLEADEPEPEPEKHDISEKLQRARARVIKIRRADVPAPEPEVTAAAEAVQHTDPDALSPEAEADLMRELASFEEDVAPEAAAEPAAEPSAVMPARPASEARRRISEGSEDEDVNRLIAQTNTEMEGPENRRRLSAIAHLKAAVVATVADRRAGAAPAPSEADRIDPYRNDLSKIVRPPVAEAGEKPAPLVLVSEQRIDRRAGDARPSVATSVPMGEGPRQIIRPRRVSSAALAMQEDMLDEEDDLDGEDDDNIFTDSKGFTEFADRLGAQELPELLEAAAAYTACVEGRPHFSRPQLIRQVNGMSTDGEFSRENSLRGFGSLLRTGKIVKIKRGQYALTESSSFLTAARKLAQ